LGLVFIWSCFVFCLLLPVATLLAIYSVVDVE